MVKQTLLTENDIDIETIGILYDIAPEQFSNDDKYLGLICSCILDSSEEDLDGLYQSLREVLQNGN